MPDKHFHTRSTERFFSTTVEDSELRPRRFKRADFDVGTNDARSVRNEAALRAMVAPDISMRMLELTRSEMCSVRCPACGAAAGKLCHLASGSTCIEPHLDRKLAAVEAVEQKRILEMRLRATNKYFRAKLH